MKRQEVVRAAVGGLLDWEGIRRMAVGVMMGWRMGVVMVWV